MSNTTPQQIPTPGSDAAIELGCTCPVKDNARGKGVPTSDGPLFWMTEGCPVHGKIEHQNKECATS
jgi:hypothetical protein